MAPVAVAVYELFRKIFFPRLTSSGEYQAGTAEVVYSGTLLGIFLLTTNYQVIFWLLNHEAARDKIIAPFYRSAVGLCTILLLYLQSAIKERMLSQQELEVTRQLWRKQQEQYQVSEENINLINCKCHDLKRQMSALRLLKDQNEIDRQIRELETAVMIYDSGVKPGSTALDVILTEKASTVRRTGSS